ncbi:MAG: protein kinase [Acidobacteriota bacterium]
MARLLVVDDDPQILELVAQVLQFAGHDVLKARDAREAPALAAHDIDAVVLDVMLPGGTSGLQLLGELRDNPGTEHLPVLLLSGRSDDVDRVAGLRAGADDYLGKPFSTDELVLRVERLLGRRGNPVRSLDTDRKYFGRYEVRDELGHGSLGTVYRGWDPRLERQVALKTLRIDPLTSDTRRAEMLDRLRQEAITVAKFNHSNIVAVYDMGDTTDSAYMAMELIDGRSLSQVLTHVNRLPIEHAVPLAAGIARGLAVAHTNEVIHRDIKPGNVMLGFDSSIKVTDFGLASVMSAMTEESALFGTPGYVPPEALDEKPFTSAGDMFSFGVTFFEVLAGVHPLAGASLRDTIINTMEGNIRPLGAYVANLPSAIETVITELLAVDPTLRPTAAMTVGRLITEIDAHGWQWDPEIVATARDETASAGAPSGHVPKLRTIEERRW